MERIYFDWAATAIPDCGTDAGFAPFGNPSSLHAEGRRARDALEESRARAAAVLGVNPLQIYFTSGGTESNTLALHSLLLRRGTGSLVFSPVEHPSIRENAEMLARLGKKICAAEVEQDGAVSPRTLRNALDKTENPRMIACMGVNNETGAVTDLAAITAFLRERGGARPHLHCDLVQQAGKVPLAIPLAELDSAAISAHKIGGPRGIGILYARASLEVFTRGGGQERGQRPGTENVAGACALAACLEKYAAPETLREHYAGAAARWKALIGALKEISRCTLIPAGRTAEDPRFSPWILQLAFDGVPGEVMVRTLDAAGFAISTGSACSSRKKERPVLKAMGVSAKTAFEGIRISQGWSTTMSGVEALLDAIHGVLRNL